MKAPLGLLLTALVLTGCAAKTGQNAAPPSSAPPPSAAASASTAASASAVPSDEATISLPPGLPKTTGVQPPVDAFQQLTVQGTVRVSGSCVELVTDKITWLLVGPAAARLRAGQQVKAVGVPDPNHESPCSGSPLLVAQVTSL